MKKLDNDNLTGINDTGKNANTPLTYLTASSILKNKVYNNEDESLGDVKDLMLDITTGKIEYVVLEFGGFLGIGEKFFAVPLESLTIDTDREAFILNQKREVLEKAPGFDKDHWPKTNSHEWHASQAYWGSFMGANTGSKY